MKVILTPDMANELREKEKMIKDQKGAYRPQFKTEAIPLPGMTLMKKGYAPVIKCWPLEEFKGWYEQERDVVPGLEGEVDDIAMAKIQDGRISYRKNRTQWVPSFDPFKRVMPEWQEMKEYSILIYTPYFDNDTIYLTSKTLPGLFEAMKEYSVGRDVDTSAVKEDESLGLALARSFRMYEGICTYVLFKGENVLKCGKWSNKKYW